MWRKHVDLPGLAAAAGIPEEVLTSRMDRILSVPLLIDTVIRAPSTEPPARRVPRIMSQLSSIERSIHYLDHVVQRGNTYVAFSDGIAVEYATDWVSAKTLSSDEVPAFHDTVHGCANGHQPGTVLLTGVLDRLPRTLSLLNSIAYRELGVDTFGNPTSDPDETWCVPAPRWKRWASSLNLGFRWNSARVIIDDRAYWSLQGCGYRITQRMSRKL